MCERDVEDTEQQTLLYIAKMESADHAWSPIIFWHVFIFILYKCKKWKFSNTILNIYKIKLYQIILKKNYFALMLAKIYQN